jgi:hypothetical protein
VYTTHAGDTQDQEWRAIVVHMTACLDAIRRGELVTPAEHLEVVLLPALHRLIEREARAAA